MDERTVMRQGCAAVTRWRRGGLARLAAATMFALALGCLVVGSASAESPDAGAQSAEASTGGTASSSADGNVAIDQIITGDNTGNAITTGDIAGSAEIQGGEIAYPTEVNVSLTIAPQVTDASGGDAGKATTTHENVPPQDDIDIDNTVINRNEVKNTNENTNENTNRNEVNATITGG
jgi:hypothetical protein